MRRCYLLLASEFLARCSGTQAESTPANAPSSKFLAPLSGIPVFKIGELHTTFYLCFLVLLVYFQVFTFACVSYTQKKLVTVVTMGSTGIETFPRHGTPSWDTSNDLEFCNYVFRH